MATEQVQKGQGTFHEPAGEGTGPTGCRPGPSTSRFTVTRHGRAARGGLLSAAACLVANPFFQRGAERANRVQALFASIARRYDRINDLQSLGLHRIWKRRLVSLARLEPGQRALDVCCGTGDVALALAQTGALVVGLDFSPAMLAIAEGRLDRTELSTAAVLFVEGDALRIPFPDGTFDAVTVAYGLRNLADLEAGIAEMRRVLRPGGRLVSLDFGKPTNAIWRSIYFGYLRMAVPVFGRLFASNAAAYGYILESLRHYPGQEEVAERMRRRGLADVTVVNLLGGAMGLHCARRP